MVARTVEEKAKEEFKPVDEDEVPQPPLAEGQGEED